jgi:hypothetical protein
MAILPVFFSGMVLGTGGPVLDADHEEIAGLGRIRHKGLECATPSGLNPGNPFLGRTQ